jgi:hypothetical protein
MSEQLELFTNTKACKICSEDKTLNSYYKHSYNSDGRCNVCKPCYSERQNLKNRLKAGFDSLKPNYCECCGQSDIRVDLDHCHKTNMFRGFICRSCNKTLGANGDNYDSVKDAELSDIYSDYLRLASFRMGENVSTKRGKYK